MTKTSERRLGLAVMQVLASRSSGEADIRTIIRHVPEYINLTVEDQEESGTRPGEEMWEQRVRNLKSHDKSVGNVIGSGFVEHVGRGRYRLTGAGNAHLKSAKLI